MSQDLRRSRQLVVRAAEDGATLGRLYVDVVRPALERTGGTAWASDAPSPADRLTIGSVQAALAVVAARPVEGAAMRGEGRQALVSVGSRPLDALDGQVIVDTLCGDGWSVTDVAAAEQAEQVLAMAEERHVQLVVMPTSNPSDVLLAAQTYTLLRRMADPPVIVACSFGRPGENRRARAIGADAFVNDPDDLLAFVDRRLPAGGERNWGVRLTRAGDTLVVAPTGDLDDSSVRRLRQVVDSRAGSFRSLLVDTRAVASVTGDGLTALLSWLSVGGGAHRILPGALMQDAFAGAPVDAALLADAADASL